jgi:hypothetical protein
MASETFCYYTLPRTGLSPFLNNVANHISWRQGARLPPFVEAMTYMMLDMDPRLRDLGRELVIGTERCMDRPTPCEGTHQQLDTRGSSSGENLADCRFVGVGLCQAV